MHICFTETSHHPCKENSLETRRTCWSWQRARYPFKTEEAASQHLLLAKVALQRLSLLVFLDFILIQIMEMKPVRRLRWIMQVLKAVNTIHEERIVHSDLKPANFLLVKGVLKLIDFGIAKAIQSDTTNIQRDSQVGTLNYMSPEAFMCNDQDENGKIIECGRPSDIWSLGCILYQMVYGKTPFADFTTFWSKYKEITNKDHKITYGPVSNPWLFDIMKKCLAWNRNERLRIPQLLEHPFLQPPISPVSLTQEEWHCKTLSDISRAYGSDGEIQSLCEKLQEHIQNLSKHTTGEQTVIDKGQVIKETTIFILEDGKSTQTRKYK